ncbi:aminotransferase class I/II-fold pyridoxal phosphate-dependent enzyme [Archangium violaceum]|uniref:trans-sulfuration enzyme family protein n=1 Tax=Archangium violaceum TaxID=83451 RepID=UPI0019502D34|nr:aminotransferase class I/II-fold pyridoxal phosphate-dependent enzyme [Archangium violaceum]QRO02213.1 aminotransferase class I/II-fold pyridoxal phosphate-dependent enzyme [Archangium violaceum]
MASEWDVRTRLVQTDADSEEGAPLNTPLVMSTTFRAHPEGVGFSAVDMGEESPFFYARWSTPTVRTLERRLADLEGGEDALCFASGMAAITGLLLHLLKPGDHLVLSDVCYAGAAEFARGMLRRYGVEVSPVDTSDLAQVRAALRPNTRLVYIETPCNPILKLTDVQAVASLAHEAGARLVVDATLATPIGLQPLALGADFVIHSLTKYIGGHGDVLGGVVVGRRTELAALRQDSLIHLGAVLSPFPAWLILRSLPTLPQRMAAHEASARAVASFLQNHPRVRHVIYPGLDSHPQAELARRQLRNTSGMIAFQTEDGPAMARRLAERMKVVKYAVSLGKPHSLVFYLPTEDLQRTSFQLPPDLLERYRAWAGDGIFRLSIGLEAPDDLIRDLDQALGP